MATLLHARIARLERDPSGHGYLLGWYSPRSTAIFEAARQAVADLPAYERCYLPDRRCWRVSQRALLSLVPRWPLLAESLAALGGASSSSSSSSRARARAHVPREVADAFAALCLTSTAPPELVKAARRYWNRQTHPDLGVRGDLARCQQFNAAADLAEQYARDHEREAVGIM